jgi:hypothetical protein
MSVHWLHTHRKFVVFPAGTLQVLVEVRDMKVQSLSGVDI